MPGGPPSGKAADAPPTGARVRSALPTGHGEPGRRAAPNQDGAAGVAAQHPEASIVARINS